MARMVVALIGFGIAFGACGDPTPTSRFEFTPVPYTVVPTSATPPGQMLVIDEGNGSLYVADEVLVTVEASNENDVVAWAAAVGFERIRTIELLDGQVMVVLRVPPGSVDDGIQFIESERDDVLDASRNVLATGNSR